MVEDDVDVYVDLTLFVSKMMAYEILVDMFKSYMDQFSTACEM